MKDMINIEVPVCGLCEDTKEVGYVTGEFDVTFVDCPNCVGDSKNE